MFRPEYCFHKITGITRNRQFPDRVVRPGKYMSSDKSIDNEPALIFELAKACIHLQDGQRGVKILSMLRKFISTNEPRTMIKTVVTVQNRHLYCRLRPRLIDLGSRKMPLFEGFSVLSAFPISFCFFNIVLFIFVTNIIISNGPFSKVYR